MVYSCHRPRLVFSHILPTDLCVWEGGGGWWVAWDGMRVEVVRLELV